MEFLEGFVAIALGLVIRVGLPLVVTVFLVRWLRQLDERWKVEAQRSPTITEGSTARNIGCWEIKECSAEKKAVCTACEHPETPCWQHFRSTNGHLQERCLNCQIFQEAPVPVLITNK